MMSADVGSGETRMADGVRIDTTQVGDFAQGLRAQQDGGFASAADRGTELHGHGVVFGHRIPSDVVLDAKQRYARALEQTDANLRSYHLAAGVLADVAERIARDFAHADLSSVEAQRTVLAMIDGAVQQANAQLGNPA
jgi:hypothetical protein